MMKTGFAFSFLFLCVQAAYAGLSFNIEAGPESTVLQAAGTRIMPLLPPLMIDRMAAISVLSVSSGGENQAGGASESAVELNLGNIRRLAVERNISFESLIDATLIHELSHVYDHLNIKSADEIKARKECQRKVPVGPRAPSTPPDPACQVVFANNRTVSTSPRMRKVSHYTSVGLLGGYSSANKMQSRSPDLYELKNSEEFFAVNMEYFLRDPQYACRRPTIYQALSDHFGFKPFENRNCDQEIHFLLSSAGGNILGIEKLKSERVYQIQYLQAASGDSIASQFGHSMFRLIICAPDRAVVGPDCMKDIMHHRVLSFRAKIEGDSFNALKGLTGSYPSMLFYMPYSSVMDDYNKKEFRDLTSYPFLISDVQKLNLLKAAAETHWSYEGRYRFLTTNCASEALLLMKNAIPENKALQALDQGRPDTLLKALLRTGLIRNVNSQAEGDQIYFSASREKFYQNLTDLINPYTQISDLKSYLDKTSVSSRSAAANLAVLKKSSKKVFAAFLVLEEIIQAKAVDQALQVIGKDVKEGNQEILSKLNIDPNLLQNLHRNRENWNTQIAHVQSGYGIPLSTDISAPPSQAEIDQYKAITEKLTEELMRAVSIYDNLKMNQEIQNSKQFINQLKTNIKESL